MNDSALLNVPLSAQSLPEPLHCPVCGSGLAVDPCWVSPHWICSSGHTYSNLLVLIAELRERGWLAEGAAREHDTRTATTADGVQLRRVECQAPIATPDAPSAVAVSAP